MPGLFDMLAPPQDAANLGDAATAFMTGGRGLLGSIGNRLANVSNYNTMSPLYGSQGALMAQTNPQAFNTLWQRQIMAETYKNLVPKVGEQNAALLAMNPSLMQELAKPQSLQAGGSLAAPLNLLGGGPGAAPYSPQGQPSQQSQGANGNILASNENGTLTDADADAIAQRYVLGDKSALDLLGRGSGGIVALNRTKVANRIQQIMQQQNMTPQSVAANSMKYEGLTKNIGQIGTSNNAINTGVGHLSQLADVFNNLGNGNFQPTNYVRNVLRELIGKEGPTNYAAVADRVAPEITRIWRGAGGAEADIERDLNTLKASNSPAQGIGAIRNIAELMNSKLEANQYQYESVFGPGSSKYMLSDTAKGGLEKLRAMGQQQQTEGQQFKPPPNWMFSKSRNQYRDPSGKIYDINGRPVQ